MIRSTPATRGYPSWNFIVGNSLGLNCSSLVAFAGKSRCISLLPGNAPKTSDTSLQNRAMPSDCETGISSAVETRKSLVIPTLNIPSISIWKIPEFPQDLNAWSNFLISAELQKVVDNPSSAAQLAYNVGKTSFFLLQGLYAANRINYKSKSGIFKNPPKTPQDYFEAVTVRMSPSLRSIAELYRVDAEFVRKGYYRAPYDMDPRHRQWNPSFVLENVNIFVEFARDVSKRMAREGRFETKETSEEARANSSTYPEYYLQNFHFQDGWLSEFSAKSYEVASETIFYGSQDAMQRGSLVPLHFFMQGRSQTDTKLLEVACGTGRFLTFVKDNYPQLNTTAVDLSPFFLSKAKENQEYFNKFDRRVNGDRGISDTVFVQAAAEKLPFDGSTFDVICCTYLFHELPAQVRVEAVKEMGRTLKVGGIVILNDSVQRKDRPEMNFSYFPENYHEPYYLSYVDTDIEGLFEENGFRLEACSVLHVSKVFTFMKV